MVIWSLKEIKGMTFPKFKKEYKKRLERLWVNEGVVSHICRFKDLTTLSLRTFSYSRCDLDYFICRVVFVELCVEVGVMGYSHTYGDYKGEYTIRLKEEEEYEKSLLEKE